MHHNKLTNAFNVWLQMLLTHLVFVLLDEFLDVETTT